MAKKHLQNTSGFTLIECMLAALMLTVILAGIMTFRYYTVFCAEQAENQLLAARAACLLSEAWRGQKGDSAFDPTQQDFDADFLISTSGSSEAPGPGKTALGSYDITMDGKSFTAHLTYGSVMGVNKLRTIQVTITWQDHRGVNQEYCLPTLTQTEA